MVKAKGRALLVDYLNYKYMENVNKQWYSSKLFWSGAILFVGNGLAALSQTVSAEALGVINTILGFLVVVFRALTGKSISFGSKNFYKGE